MSMKLKRKPDSASRIFTLIELLAETARFSGDSEVDQGMRYERGEMR